MMNNNIATSAESLREIANDIVNYTESQCDTIKTYLKLMSSQEMDIQSTGYKMVLEAISAWQSRMEELKEDGMKFVEYIREKADILDEIKNKGASL